MRQIRSILWSVLVLATTTSVLFANVPISFCACRGEQRTNRVEEPPTSNCCCSGGCCAPKPDADTCCGPKSSEVPGDNTGPILILPHCHLIATQPEVVSVEERSAQVVLECLVAADQGVMIAPSPGSSATLSFAHVFQEPPPTDLVVTLQHFLN